MNRQRQMDMCKLRRHKCGKRVTGYAKHLRTRAQSQRISKLMLYVQQDRCLTALVWQVKGFADILKVIRT